LGVQFNLDRLQVIAVNAIVYFVALHYVD